MTIKGKFMVASEGKTLRRKVGYPVCRRAVFLTKVEVDGQMQEDKPENWEEIELKGKEAHNG